MTTFAMGFVLLSVVVITGYAGQLSLGQFALAGFGAWVAGRLVDALRRYRAIAAHGDWPLVPAGTPLSAGDDDARVAVLRRRLACPRPCAGSSSGPVD